MCDDARARAFGRVAAICPRACVARASSSVVARVASCAAVASSDILENLHSATTRVSWLFFSSISPARDDVGSPSDHVAKGNGKAVHRVVRRER